MLANCCGAGTDTVTGAGTGTATATGEEEGEVEGAGKDGGTTTATATGTGTGTGSETGFCAGIAVGSGSGAVAGLAVTKGEGAVGAVARATASVAVTGDIAATGAGVGAGVGVWAPATGGVGRLRSAEAGLTVGALSGVLSGAGARLAPSSITRVFSAETCSGTGRALSGCSRYPCPMATMAQSTASVCQFGRPLGAPLTPGDGECSSCDMFIR